ncbi:MAG: hypothetical protein WCF54_06415 [Terracidiphilus sp.]
MKNITISVDDKTYLQARVFAAWSNTSVPALFRQFLSPLGDPPSPALGPPKHAEKRFQKFNLPRI